MKEYDAYIFDMDLTVVDTIVPSIKSYKDSFKVAGFDFDEATIYHHLARSLGHTYDEFINPICTKDEFVNAYVKTTKTCFVNEAKIYPDALNKIKELASKGKKLGVVTNRATYEINQVLEKAGLYHLFDAIITCDQVNKLKPDPESINLCLKKMGVSASSTVYVGDAENDFKAAKNANVDFIAIERYNNCKFDAPVVLKDFQKL